VQAATSAQQAASARLTAIQEDLLAARRAVSHFEEELETKAPQARHRGRAAGSAGRGRSYHFCSSRGSLQRRRHKRRVRGLGYPELLQWLVAGMDRGDGAGARGELLERLHSIVSAAEQRVARALRCGAQAALGGSLHLAGAISPVPSRRCSRWTASSPQSLSLAEASHAQRRGGSRSTGHSGHVLEAVSSGKGASRLQWSARAFHSERSDFSACRGGPCTGIGEAARPGPLPVEAWLPVM